MARHSCLNVFSVTKQGKYKSSNESHGIWDKNNTLVRSTTLSKSEFRMKFYHKTSYRSLMIKQNKTKNTLKKCSNRNVIVPALFNGRYSTT